MLSLHYSTINIKQHCVCSENCLIVERGFNNEIKLSLLQVTVMVLSGHAVMKDCWNVASVFIKFASVDQILHEITEIPVSGILPDRARAKTPYICSCLFCLTS